LAHRGGSFTGAAGLADHLAGRRNRGRCFLSATSRVGQSPPRGSGKGRGTPAPQRRQMILERRVHLEIDDDLSLDRCIGLYFAMHKREYRRPFGSECRDRKKQPSPQRTVSRRGEYRPEGCAEGASVRRSAGGGAVPRPREPMDRLRFKARSARRQGLTGVTGRVPLPSRTPRSASRIKRDHRPPVFSTGRSPHQSILPSQDRSIPCLRLR
jgi:hypothetical protein